MKRRRGYGFQEVLSNSVEIQGFLDKGHTVAAAYRKFSEEKKITVCLQRFHAILSKFGIRRKALEQLKLPSEIWSTAQKLETYTAIKRKQSALPMPLPLTQPEHKNTSLNGRAVFETNKDDKVRDGYY